MRKKNPPFHTSSLMKANPEVSWVCLFDSSTACISSSEACLWHRYWQIDLLLPLWGVRKKWIPLISSFFFSHRFTLQIFLSNLTSFFISLFTLLFFSFLCLFFSFSGEVEVDMDPYILGALMWGPWTSSSAISLLRPGLSSIFSIYIPRFEPVPPTFCSTLTGEMKAERFKTNLCSISLPPWGAATAVPHCDSPSSSPSGVLLL